MQVIAFCLIRLHLQVGGTHKSLEEHIEAVKENHLLGADIDFKLAKSLGPESELAIRESHFDSLQVTVCKVLRPDFATYLSIQLRKQF